MFSENFYKQIETKLQHIMMNWEHFSLIYEVYTYIRSFFFTIILRTNVVPTLPPTIIIIAKRRKISKCVGNSWLNILYLISISFKISQIFLLSYSRKIFPRSYTTAYVPYLFLSSIRNIATRDIDTDPIETNRILFNIEIYCIYIKYLQF